jgi:hypothetical protein
MPRACSDEEINEKEERRLINASLRSADSFGYQTGIIAVFPQAKLRDRAAGRGAAIRG